MMASANRVLAGVALVLIILCLIYLGGALEWLQLDLRPGSRLGQSIGIIAGLILLGTLYYVPFRRSDNTVQVKSKGQNWHALVGTSGTALAVIHSHAALREWSTLVLLAILGLLVTGLYGRVVAPLRVGVGFGRSAIPYSNVARPDAKNAEVDRLIQAKRTLLKSIAANEKESEFVLRWQHWSCHPLITLQFYRLVLAERRLLAKDPLSASEEIPALERFWRRLHLLLAILFLIGLLAHVITTVFFAGYVADGREIYWWHVTQW